MARVSKGLCGPRWEAGLAADPAAAFPGQLPDFAHPAEILLSIRKRGPRPSHSTRFDTLAADRPPLGENKMPENNPGEIIKNNQSAPPQGPPFLPRGIRSPAVGLAGPRGGTSTTLDQVGWPKANRPRSFTSSGESPEDPRPPPVRTIRTKRPPSLRPPPHTAYRPPSKSPEKPSASHPS